MELINNPTFWEVLGAILILAFAAPVVYLIGVVIRIVYDAWKAGAFPQRPEARILDPTFGPLRRSADSCWTGEVIFSPTQQSVGVSIDASADGPTDEQRSLFLRIQQKYDEILPEITRSLAEYVEEDWQFELCDIELPADPQSDKWTGQFVKTEEENFMGYFVDVVDWKVAGVTGVD